jgi:denticleless
MLQPINENLFPIFTPPDAPVKKRPRLEPPRSTVTSYFSPATPTRPKAIKENVWRIPRRRTGLGAYKSLSQCTVNRCAALRHAAGPWQSGKPNVVFIPSIHPPTGRSRDLAPILAIATSRAAGNGHVAVAGEEGGVRIVSLDKEAEGPYEGVWWRAHGNAIFDVSWSPDDTQLVRGLWAR